MLHLSPPQASPPSFPSGSPVLRLSPCLHRSLEGLNQELEEVFVKEQGEEELLRVSGARVLDTLTGSILLSLDVGKWDSCFLALTGRGYSDRATCKHQHAEGTPPEFIRLRRT